MDHKPEQDLQQGFTEHEPLEQLAMTDTTNCVVDPYIISLF